MASIHFYSNWNKRGSDLEAQVEPYRKYIFICEGKNTEDWYISNLIDMKKELGIHSLIEIKLMKKPEGEENNSNPKKLFEYANKIKNEMKDSYDANHDKMIVVFDADFYQKKAATYKDLLQEGREYMLAVTYPSFELFLILHYEDAFEKYIKPNEKSISENKKVSKKRKFIDMLFSQISGMNSKENPNIGKLVTNIDIAIDQERLVNQDISIALCRPTSNIASIIRMIKEDGI